MKAAICYEFNQPLVIEEIDIDPPARGEVKVRVAATGICHSDIRAIHGGSGGSLPVIMGHETAGHVQEVGEGVTRVKPGDPVIVSLLRACDQCYYCTHSQPHLCSGSFTLQTENRLHTRTGQPIRQGLYVGGFAEEVVVDQSQLVPLPADMPLDRAALLACAVITGLGAVTNTARVRQGQSVVVIGAGGVGINAVQGARLCGAHPIIAVDVVPGKLATALAFGATHAINSKEQDAASAVRDLTGGRGADYVFATVGIPAAMASALTMSRRGGSVVLVGITPQGASIPLPLAETVLGARTITGSYMGSTRLSADAPRLVELYQGGKLMLDELISGRYPLECINDAIASSESGEDVRNVIVF